MNRPGIVSQAEWLGARKALLAKEKEFTRQRDALNAERRRLPMVRVDKDYVLESPHGPARLLDLFEGRQQLIVYHFMLDPSWDAGCPSCSFLTDNIGHLAHLHARKTTLALVSRVPFKNIEAYRKRMGWTRDARGALPDQEPGIEIVGVEQPFDVPLIDLDTGEVLDRALVGTLDLMERDTEGHPRRGQRRVGAHLE